MNKAYLWGKLGNEIQAVLLDHQVNEVICNSDGSLWVLHHIQGYKNVGTMPQHQALAFVHAYAQHDHQFLNENKPYLDGVLPFHGERINITISPLHEGVAFTIRKRAQKIYALQEYVEQGVITVTQKTILQQALLNQNNILISGGPGTGKTTFANALLDEIAVISELGHRVLILEQVPELQCRLPNCHSMVTTDKWDLCTLLWIAMRTSPQRIVVGEVRDGSALTLLKAWNTGCSRGGIATIHANSPHAAVQRILDLSLETTTFPPYALAAESLDIIVQLESKPEIPAKRLVTGIVQVKSYDRSSNEFLFHNLEKVCETN